MQGPSCPERLVQEISQESETKRRPSNINCGGINCLNEGGPLFEWGHTRTQTHIYTKKEQQPRLALRAGRCVIAETTATISVWHYNCYTNCHEQSYATSCANYEAWEGASPPPNPCLQLVIANDLGKEVRHPLHADGRILLYLGAQGSELEHESFKAVMLALM